MSKTIRRRKKLAEHDIKRIESCPADEQARNRRGRLMKAKNGEQVVHGIRVSDHAVVRFIEIVLGMDVRKIRESILGDGRWKIAAKEGFCKLPLNGTGKVVVRDGVVVTILKRAKDYDSEA